MGFFAVSEEIHQTHSNEIEADISIGTENPDHEPVEDFQSQEVHINARDYHGKPEFLVLPYFTGFK